MSQKCEISSGDIPLVKGKNRKDAPRRPKTRLRVGGKMTGRRMLVRQVMPAAWVGTRI